MLAACLRTSICCSLFKQRTQSRQQEPGFHFGTIRGSASAKNGRHDGVKICGPWVEGPERASTASHPCCTPTSEHRSKQPRLPYFPKALKLENALHYWSMLGSLRGDVFQILHLCRQHDRSTQRPVTCGAQRGLRNHTDGLTLTKSDTSHDKGIQVGPAPTNGRSEATWHFVVEALQSRQGPVKAQPPPGGRRCEVQIRRGRSCRTCLTSGKPFHQSHHEKLLLPG